MAHEIKILQLKNEQELRHFFYSSLEFLRENNLEVDLNNYNKVYEGTYESKENKPESILENIFIKLQGTKPEGYKGHSLSVSDIVVLDGVYWYCDNYGFERINHKSNNLNQTTMKKQKIEAQPIMSKEEMEQFVEQNISAVGPRTVNKFKTWSLETQVEYLRKRIDFLNSVEEIKENNKLSNQVLKLLMKKKATTDDVNEIIKACQDYITLAKQAEIAKIENEIERLNELKEQLQKE